jgi:hypothetical protein
MTGNVLTPEAGETLPEVHMSGRLVAAHHRALDGVDVARAPASGRVYHSWRARKHGLLIRPRRLHLRHAAEAVLSRNGGHTCPLYTDKHGFLYEPDGGYLGLGCPWHFSPIDFES